MSFAHRPENPLWEVSTVVLRPCLGLPGMPCHKLVPKRRCTACESARNKARDAARGNSSQRGLGAEHRAQVRALVAAHVAEHGDLPTHCPECGHAYAKGTRYALSGQHDEARAHNKDSMASSLCCVSCNASAGARIRRLS